MEIDRGYDAGRVCGWPISAGALGDIAASSRELLAFLAQGEALIHDRATHLLALNVRLRCIKQGLPSCYWQPKYFLETLALFLIRY